MSLSLFRSCLNVNSEEEEEEEEKIFRTIPFAVAVAVVVNPSNCFLEDGVDQGASQRLVPAEEANIIYIRGVALYVPPGLENDGRYVPVHWTELDSQRNSRKKYFRYNSTSVRTISRCPAQILATGFYNAAEEELIRAKHGGSEYVLWREANFYLDTKMLPVLFYDYCNGCRLPECEDCSSRSLHDLSLPKVISIT